MNVTGFTYSWFTTLSDPTGTQSIAEIDFSWVTYTNLIVCGQKTINYITVYGNVLWNVNGIPGWARIVSCKLSKLDGVGYSYWRFLSWANSGGASQASFNIPGGGGNNGNNFYEVDFSLDTTLSNTRLLSGNNNKNVYILPNGTSSQITMSPTFSSTPNTVCYGRDNQQMAIG